MAGATVRAMAVLAVTVLFATACVDTGEAKEPPAEVKTRAEVEATVRAEIQAIADLAGSTVTTWTAKTPRCDAAHPGRKWAMTGSAEIPLAADKQVDAIRAILSRWSRARWQFADARTTPDVSLSATVTGSLLAAHPTAGFNVSVTGSSTHDRLAVGFGTRCFQPAKGEDPANA